MEFVLRADFPGLLSGTKQSNTGFKGKYHDFQSKIPPEKTLMDSTENVLQSEKKQKKQR